MNSQLTPSASAKVLQGKQQIQTVNKPTNGNNTVCSFFNIPLANVVQVVSPRPVASVMMQNQRQQKAQSSMTSSPRLVLIKSPIVRSEKPVKVSNERLLCANCGVMVPTSSIRKCCGKFQAVSKPNSKSNLAKPYHPGRARLYATDQIAQMPSSSLNVSRFYGPRHAGEDYDSFVTALQQGSSLQVKRSHRLVPPNAPVKSDFITILDSSDESDSESTAAKQPTTPVNGILPSDKKGIQSSPTSSTSPVCGTKKPAVFMNDASKSPIPCKRLKQDESSCHGQQEASKVTTSGMLKDADESLSAATTLIVQTDEDCSHEILHLELKSVRVGQFHQSGTILAQVCSKFIAIPLKEEMLKLDWFAITSVEICPDELGPCMFIFLSSDYVPTVRSQLHMEMGKSPYFDPEGEGDMKYVILFPCPAFYKSQWKALQKKLQEIRKKMKKPKDYIDRVSYTVASQRQTQIAQMELERQDSKKSAASVQLQDDTHQVTANDVVALRVTRSRTTKASPGQNNTVMERFEVRHLFTGPRVQLAIYPPPPAKGGISITNEDQFCLNEGEFLNDVIIDFYLKYIMQEVLSDFDRTRSHVFSCFFYKRLTQSAGGKVSTESKVLNVAERRHNRVMKWTRNVDIFEKDYVFVPINESSHWYLAVICFPGQVGGLLVNQETGKILSDAFLKIITSYFPSDKNHAHSSCSATPTSAVQSKRLCAKSEGKTSSLPSEDQNGVEPNEAAAKIETKNGVEDKPSTGEDKNVSTASDTNKNGVEIKETAKNEYKNVASVTETDKVDVIISPEVETSEPSPTQEPTINIVECEMEKVEAKMNEIKVSPLQGDSPLPDTVGEDYDKKEKVASQEAKPCERSAEIPPEPITSDEKSSTIPEPVARPNLGSPQSEQPIKQTTVQYREPCILIFDSLRGSTRSRTSTVLREYLNLEWKTRKEPECGPRIFDKNTMRMNTPAVPQQDNYSDCGLFLLEYAQQIFKKPIANFNLPIKNLQNWFNPAICKNKRGEIHRIIDQLHSQQTTKADGGEPT